MFEAEKDVILAAIGEHITAIEHVGSTSVPGLAAKPIIDIMIGLRKLEDARGCIEPLEVLGYQYVPEFEAEMPERRYFRKGTCAGRTHHAHMVEEGGEFWERHLLFRDALREDPAAARQYAYLKRRLAAQFSADRDGYTLAKTEFITGLEAKARARKAASPPA